MEESRDMSEAESPNRKIYITTIQELDGIELKVDETCDVYLSLNLLMSDCVQEKPCKLTLERSEDGYSASFGCWSSDETFSSAKGALLQEVHDLCISVISTQEQNAMAGFMQAGKVVQNNLQRIGSQSFNLKEDSIHSQCQKTFDDLFIGVEVEDSDEVEEFDDQLQVTLRPELWTDSLGNPLLRIFIDTNIGVGGTAWLPLRLKKEFNQEDSESLLKKVFGNITNWKESLHSFLSWKIQTWESSRDLLSFTYPEERIAMLRQQSIATRRMKIAFDIDEVLNLPSDYETDPQAIRDSDKPTDTHGENVKSLINDDPYAIQVFYGTAARRRRENSPAGNEDRKKLLSAVLDDNVSFRPISKHDGLIYLSISIGPLNSAPTLRRG